MSVANNLQKIEEQLAKALIVSGRNRAAIRLLAVTKKQSCSLLKEAYLLGVRDFGENYFQEFAAKKNELSDLDINWHFIGRIQSKKAKLLADDFSLIHSVDRFSVLQKLPAQSSFLLQVNLGGEESKGGILPAQGPEFLAEIQKNEKIRLCGLMVMPPQDESARRYFVQLRELADSWQEELSGPHKLKELSMGTSGDYAIAVEEGATIIRLGTALFGSRPS